MGCIGECMAKTNIGATERPPGKILHLPASTTHVRFGDLANLIANALWPEQGADGALDRATFARGNIDAALRRAVRDGSLRVLNGLDFGPEEFPHGETLRIAMVSVEDLHTWLQDTRGMTVQVAVASPELPDSPTTVKGMRTGPACTPPPGLTYWKQVLFVRILDIDRMYQGKATSREAIAFLKGLGDRRLTPRSASKLDMLQWQADSGNWNSISKKTVGNALPQARRWASDESSP